MNFQLLSNEAFSESQHLGTMLLNNTLVFWVCMVKATTSEINCTLRKQVIVCFYLHPLWKTQWCFRDAFPVVSALGHHRTRFGITINPRAHQ